jgi:cysteine desulfurase/selenocysteine lyase
MSSIGRYLDHAASSWPKPDRVLEAVQRFLREEAGNPGRGGHWLARRAAEQQARSRRALARFLGIKQAERLIFTSGATESLNMVLRHWPAPGERALVSPMEHNAVLRPLAARAAKGDN